MRSYSIWEDKLSFAKLKIKNVGTFKVKSFEELEDIVDDLRLKYKGEKIGV